jgi:hypothetical protein
MVRYPLAKHYEQLNPRQRLQLVLAAEGRQDHAEVDRLVEACPRHTYSMCDAVFGDAHRAVFQVNLATLGDIYRLLAEYRTVQRMCSAMLPFMKLAAMETEQALFRDTADEPAPMSTPTIDSPIISVPTELSRPADSDVNDMIDRSCSERLPRTTLAVEKLRHHIGEGILSRLHGILAGYDRFCRRVLDMSATEVLRALDPDLLIELPVCEDAPVDEEQADRTESLLIQIWAQHCG